VPARRAAYSRHTNVGKFFTAICLYEIVVWSLYALVWGLADENQFVTVDVEIILFALVWRTFNQTDLARWLGKGGVWWVVVGYA
jgi:hypothetical protein